MAMKINGISGGSFPLPRLIKNYVYTKFDPKMQANVNGTIQNVDVKLVLEKAWKGLVDRAKSKPCNECFKLLFRKKTLTEILAEGDIVLHCLEPKQGFTYADLPEANTAGRDIGLDPTSLFDSDPNSLVCTLVHEVAHIGGASTDAGAPFDQAHAAEKTLLSCACTKHYRKNVLGRLMSFTPKGQFA